MAKTLILLGLLFLVVGIILNFAGQLPFSKLSKLPGDIVVKRDNFIFYFPITTSIAISIFLTLILSYFFKR
ncbi:MAG: DUF2905 domain-containing protein [Acidobacteriia bacterium]|nr:DUF2905 domain-containing protein [Terriglobia bacterium]